ncbi:MAG TPA: OsmC family protein [Saprospiraceae bacterium]|nr:OsmC family protein [Saprospiraceae bacterium]
METTVKAKKTTNGVDLKRLTDTIRAVQENPTLGQFKFRAKNHWNDCGHNTTTIKGFYGAGQEDESRHTPFILDNDEPDVLLGTDSAPNPVEYILHALAGCLTTSLVYHGAARGIHIESVESTYEGILDLQGFLGINENVRKGYQKINIQFDIKGNMSENEKRELLALGQQYSPVFDVITRPVDVEVTLQ